MTAKKGAKVRTPIFAKDDCDARRGFTLAEMLVALAILSMTSLITASFINARSSRLAVDRTAETLFNDLKQIRLRAEIRGEAIEFIGAASGYETDNGWLVRAFPKGVVVLWNDNPETNFKIPFGPEHEGVNIRLAKGGEAALIVVAPVTGRISRAR